jgi:hypothetical protein
MFLNLNSTASAFFCQELALNTEQCNLPKILENLGALPALCAGNRALRGQNYAGLRFCGRTQSVQTYSRTNYGSKSASRICECVPGWKFIRSRSLQSLAQNTPRGEYHPGDRHVNHRFRIDVIFGYKHSVTHI